MRFPPTTTPLKTRLSAAWEALDAELVEGLKRGLLLGVATLAVVLPPGGGLATARWQPAAEVQAPAVSGAPRYADFGTVDPPEEVRRIADWAADSRDNGALDFIVLDKRQAHVYVFDSQARLRAETPVLLGAAVGDDTAEGVGQKALHEVKPEERTTPAGRFIGQSGRNSHGEDVFWVDYAAAVSMHRLRQLEESERRLERLATATADDNRISYGCINIPLAFFESVMVPSFRGKRGVVYVLPEVRSLDEVFPQAYDPARRPVAPTTPEALTATR